MNGYDIYRKAVVLLGYTDENGEVFNEKGLLSRAVSAINQIGLDLCSMKPIQCLQDKIEVEDKALEAFPYGVGMLLSFGEGDGEKNRLFCELYNLKRTTVKSKKTNIRDVLPVDDGGY